MHSKSQHGKASLNLALWKCIKKGDLTGVKAIFNKHNEGHALTQMAKLAKHQNQKVRLSSQPAILMPNNNTCNIKDHEDVDSSI